jgi:predicted enzyme related to lactoylglutathione lyase
VPETDLFAGIPVSDYARAVAWYEQLLGAAPSFLPNDTEAVWEVADHRFLYVDVRPEHAGHAMQTVFVEDFDARLRAIADRGLEPAEVETYENGVRKAIFRDPDGNEFGFGGGPAA